MMTDFVLKRGILTQYTGPGGDVVIPDGVSAIGDRAFYDCLDLTRVVLPEGVLRIGKDAFYNCQGLTEAVLPQSLLELGERAFYNCWRLPRIDVPAGVARLPKGVFEDCQSLTDVTLHEGLREVEGRAFGCCHQLKSLRLPDTVTALHKTALVSYNDLERLRADGVPLGELSGQCRLAVLTEFACRLADGEAFPADRLAEVMEAIRKDRKKLFPYAVRQKELLRLMLKEKLVPPRSIQSLLDEADRQGSESAKAAVMEYQQNI